MDFSRWSVPSIKEVSDHVRQVREFLVQVLEGERALIEGKNDPVDETPLFQRFDDLSTLTADLQKWAARREASSTRVFAALALYYEAGFSIRRTGNELKLESMFLFGRVFTPPPAEAPIVDFGLKRRRHFDGVLRGAVRPILREARLDVIKTLNRADAFAFESEADRIFLLISDRPHPWQVLALESTYLAVREALAVRHD